tara:strand:+ start:14556 stop:15221 length:666 start_codon:yes stop_codon:yes gene_type:complete
MLIGLEEALLKYELPDDVRTAITDDVNGIAKPVLDKKTELELKVSKKENLNAAEKAELAQLQAYKSTAEIEAAKLAQDWEKASGLERESWKKEKQALLEENTNYKQSESKRLITDGISSQLNEIKLNPMFANTTKAFFESQSKVIGGKAMIGDKTQSEFITEWSQSDEGKAYCLAPQNSGGDGLGGNTAPANTEVVNEAAEAAKKSGDVGAYLAASMTPQT